MDNIINKFYSNGRQGSQNYGKLGVFSASMINPHGINKNPYNPLNSSAEIRPIINKIIPPSSNNTINNYSNYNNYRIYTPQKSIYANSNTYLYPKRLMFNSLGDILYHNPFKSNTRGQLSLIKENLLYENKKNNIKMQMIEEKMKNLELKNKKLEVINDFFFDMFENNVNEKIRRQKEEEEKQKIYYESSDSDSEDAYLRQRKKRLKKLYKSKSDVDINNYNNYRKEHFDALAFQKKTEQNARNILNDIKNSIGNYLVEEEFKKNEKIQSLNEGINELKSDLNNKLENIQKMQKQQMQNLAYWMINSGNDKHEGMPMRMFNNNCYNYNDLGNNIFNYIEERVDEYMNKKYKDNSRRDSQKNDLSGMGNDYKKNKLQRNYSDVFNFGLRKENRIIPEEDYG